MIIRSIFSNWVGLAVTGVISIFLTPFMIHRLGNFEYGMWVLVGSLLDYYGLLGLGMRTAVFRFVSQFKGSVERDALDKTFVSSLFLTVITGLMVSAASLLLAFPLPAFFKVADAARPAFRWLIILLGFSIGITFPARLLGTYLSALQRWDLYNMAAILTTLLRALLIVFVLSRGFGIIGVGIVSLGIAVLSLLFHWILVRRADPEISVDVRRSSWLRIKELFRFGVHSSLIMVGDYLRFYSDSSVIGKG